MGWMEWLRVPTWVGCSAPGQGGRWLSARGPKVGPGH
uniref:Uncharacterized protein n=1 Tax=Arundo donax TaxID=35708 RepID=A0A0A9HE85_ARUDO